MIDTIARRRFVAMASAAVCAGLSKAADEKPAIGITELLDGTAMVRVPPGEFQMGSGNGNPDEQPVHHVRITRPFEIGRYEVTQAQWEGVMRYAHTKPDVKSNFSNFQGLSLPVESITWDEAQDFLTRLDLRDPDHVYRLPTEAEWEYASQGGPHKQATPAIDAAAWYGGNSQQQTHAVGMKRPNALGLFDTLGNVAEWVHDWYGRDYYSQSPAADPQGPDTGSYRVYRGGGWFDEAKNCRTAYRGFDFPSNKVYNVGFRVVRTPRV